MRGAGQFSEIKRARSHLHYIERKRFIDIFLRYNKNRKIIATSMNRINGYYKTKMFQKAIREAEKLVKLDSLVSLIYNMHFTLGRCNFNIGEIKRAISCLRDAERIEPNNYHINLLLARCYKNVLQESASRSELEKAVEKIGDTYIVNINDNKYGP